MIHKISTLSKSVSALTSHHHTLIAATALNRFCSTTSNNNSSNNNPSQPNSAAEPISKQPESSNTNKPQQDQQRFQKYNKREPNQNQSRYSRPFNNNNNNDSRTHATGTTMTERSAKDFEMQKFIRLLEEKAYTSPQFKELRGAAMAEIAKKTDFKQLSRFYRGLNNKEFSDATYLNAIVDQARVLRTSFESVDLTMMTMFSLILSLKADMLSQENLAFAKQTVEFTHRLIKKLDMQTFKHLNFGFSSLSNIFIDDYTLYDSLITQFENNQDTLTDFEFSFLITKIFGLISKLKTNTKYLLTSKVIAKRVSTLMGKTKTIKRFEEITQAALVHPPSTTQNPLNLNVIQTISHIAIALSRQGNLLQIRQEQPADEANATSSDSTTTTTTTTTKAKFDPTKQTESINEVSWKNIEEFIIRHYLSLDDQIFKFFLQAIVAARVGSDNLFSVLLRDFHRRVMSKKPTDLHKDFFCMCLRSFYISRTIPVNIDEFFNDFDSVAKQIVHTLKPDHKLTLTTSYATIGKADMVKFFLDTYKQSEIDALNLRGKILLFWSFCNSNVFHAGFFEKFLLHEDCNPSNAYYGTNVQQLVQIAHIFMIVKMNQHEFWKPHSQHIELERRAKEFAELSHFYHSKHVQAQVEYRTKTIGSFDIADLLNAFGVEFYSEPVIEKIFNIDFVVKGITPNLLMDIDTRKKAVAATFYDFQHREYINSKKFEESTMKVNRNKDILLEVDGKNHFVSRSMKRQSSQTKLDALKKLGYQIVQVDQFQLAEIAKMDRVKAVEFFLHLFNSSLRTKSPKEPTNQPSDTQ